MTNVVENELETAIRAALVNDATLAALATSGVWNGAADQGTECPFVVFNEQSGSSPYLFGDRKALLDYTFIVKGVTEGYATLLAGQIDKAIDDALTAAKLTVTGYSVLVCRRTRNVNYSEVDHGRSFRHRGGEYAIQLT